MSSSKAWLSPRTNNRWVTIHFLKCRHCNYIFFANKQQKEKYLQMENAANEGITSFLKDVSSTKPKDLKSVGSSNKKEPSASVRKK